MHLLLGNLNNQIKLMAVLDPPLPFNAGLEELVKAEVIFLRGEQEPEPLFAAQEGPLFRRVSGEGRGARVAAVDSSCRRIGETLRGTIYATRVACVLCREKKVLGHMRLGPFLSYLTDDMLARLARPLPLQDLLAVDPGFAERFLRRMAERWLQRQLVLEGELDYLLIDGPLTFPLPEPPPYGLRALLDEARKRGTALLGLSKTTRLRALMKALSYLGRAEDAPCYMKVREPDAGAIATYVVRLTKGGECFRLDLDERACTIEGALLDLRRNDALTAGYPEGLRLAHHLCVIGDVDMASVASYIMAKLGAQQVSFLPRRRLLLPVPGPRA